MIPSYTVHPQTDWLTSELLLVTIYIHMHTHTQTPTQLRFVVRVYIGHMFVRLFTAGSDSWMTLACYWQCPYRKYNFHTMHRNILRYYTHTTYIYIHRIIWYMAINFEWILNIISTFRMIFTGLRGIEGILYLHMRLLMRSLDHSLASWGCFETMRDLINIFVWLPEYVAMEICEMILIKLTNHAIICFLLIQYKKCPYNC